MKYYLCMDNRDISRNPYIRYSDNATYFHDEEIARKEFLQDVFKLYFVRSEKNSDRIVLESFPFNSEPDIYIFVGHGDVVANELTRLKEILHGKITLIISCFDISAPANKSLLNSLNAKSIFLGARNKETVFYDKGYSNFEFRITELERQLYLNRDESLMVKIEKSFDHYVF